MAIVRGLTSVSQLPATATLGDDPCTRDQEWELYQALFMGYHTNQLQAIQGNYLSGYNSFSGNSAPGNCGTIPPMFTQIFLDANSGSGQTGYVNLNNLVSTVQTTGATSPPPPSPNSTSASCATTCLAYAQGWLQSLAPCLITSSTPA
jgi:hypothetical protein